MLQIRELQPTERPREKLELRGPSNLSDVELLAVILGSGTKGYDVLTIARALLPMLDRGGMAPASQELASVPGIGEAKAALLIAALEFARRRIRPAGVRITRPADLLPLVQHLADRRQEHFVCVSLNGAHEVLATRVITIGLANSTQVHPREVFADPITDRACAVMVAHNHPSGDVTPSGADRRVTSSLKAAGEVLGIPLLDHIVFSALGFYSFREAGELQ